MTPPVGSPEAVAELAAEHLAALIRIPTVTPDGPGPLSDAKDATMRAHRAALEAFYPHVFGAAEVDELPRRGMLLRIQGIAADRPVVLMAHQDVVPVPEDWEAEGWEHPPFDGVIADGWVHGRGALDDKGALVVMLEAVEALLAEGWQPREDLYLLMGADEEAYGDCAMEAAALLKRRGVVPYMVLDEGGAVASEAFPGVGRPMAVVGVSEKGIVTLRLTAESLGGHASTPPEESAAGALAWAIQRLESHPFPGSLHDVQVEMFTTVAPHAAGILGRVLGAAGALRWLLARVLPRVSPEMAATVRTTTAVTRLQGSPADNVLATRASAVVNMRVAVDWTVADAVRRIRNLLGPDITVTVVEQSAPSPVSPTGDDPRWRAIGEAVAASYPDAVTVPYIMLAASDARHMAHLSEAVYRFAPLHMNRAQREAIHGPNEKVQVTSLGQGVQFYRALLTGTLFDA